jgi:thiol-disulfide isomerase/thioredoxin
MRFIGKVILIIVILGILLGASAYVILYTDETEIENGMDTEPPQITDISGNQTVPAGQSITIRVQFKDNVNVTEAIFSYKTADATNWTRTSILSKSISLDIPEIATENYYYYVTVNDAAGNGPIGDPSNDGSKYYVIAISPPEALVHTVFVEEATASWCTNCPSIAAILHDLYKTKTNNFYYVSLINEANTQTDDRLVNEYNIAGYPTVFIDGGYNVLIGANHSESDLAAALQEARYRTVPKIKISMTAEYLNATEEVIVDVLVENRETTSYSGSLKVYLTEIISHLTGYDNKPYEYGFLEYALVQDVTLQGNTKQTYSETSDISMYDHENLMLIAVVFGSEKHTEYADPRSNDNPFDAYYADATNATLVVQGGNLPPIVQITSPEKGKIYRNQNRALLQIISDRNRILKRMQNVTIIKNFMYDKIFILGFGSIKITVNASDDSAISLVEFYIDDTLYYDVTEPPYEWTCKKVNKFIPSLFLRQHTLKVIAYDDTGKSSSAELVFNARI